MSHWSDFLTPEPELDEDQHYIGFFPEPDYDAILKGRKEDEL